MILLKNLFLILVTIVIGDALTRRLGLPIPGPILGLLMFGTLFVWRGTPDATMAKTFDHVIPHAPLLFVPAGAGVVAYLDVIAPALVAIVSVVTLGTAAALLVAGVIMQKLLRWHDLRQVTDGRA